MRAKTPIFHCRLSAANVTKGGKALAEGGRLRRGSSQRSDLEMLRGLKPGEFVQGTIFSCGVAESYPTARALGLLITARCDTAQDKAAVYNYVPVIPLEEWIVRDGLSIVAKRAMANGFGTMKNALNDADMAPSILEFIDPKSVLEHLQEGVSKQEKNLASRFSKGLLEINAAKMIIDAPDVDPAKAIKYMRSNESLYKSVIKELMTNLLSEFHYIERSELSEETRGYVALMREIRFISAALGRLIAVGLTKKEFDDFTISQSVGLNHLKFDSDDDFAMPLSCISSPNIEFFMQRFTSLFARIGVEDVPKERIAEAHSWLMTTQGADQ